MISMESMEDVRRSVLVEGKSQRETALTLGLSRNTVAKYLEASGPPEYRRKVEVFCPAVGPFMAIIDAWLEADKRAPKKQRHNGTRIYERLKAEYGYRGSVSAVRRYLKHRRAVQGEVFFPLVFAPGEEAQVDWGEAKVFLNEEEIAVSLFCMRLPYSRAEFVRAYPCQTLEMFLDGHVRAFEFFGGIPRRLAYDNLKSAVIQVGKGRDRKLNKKFLELRSHYLFQSRFCNVASGWEKGHAENLVKTSQRTFLTPLPHVLSFEDLNARLLDECLVRFDRSIREAEDRVCRNLLEEERSRFLPLPQKPFDACIRQFTTASKQALVSLQTNFYSVPVEYAHRMVQAKRFSDRIEIWHDLDKIACHERSFGRFEYCLCPNHYLPLLEKKPGGIFNGRPFKGEPWGEEFTRLRSELEYRYGGEGTKKFIRVLLFFVDHPEEKVKAAVRRSVAQRAFSDEAISSLLHFQEPATEASFRLDLSMRPLFQTVCSGVRNAFEYDQALLGRREEALV